MRSKRARSRTRVTRTDRRARRFLRAVGFLATAALLAQVPVVSSHLAAIPTLLESVGFEVPRPFAADVVEGRARLGTSGADAYISVPPGPPVVFVPGAAEPSDERVVRTARAFARSGRSVLVPHLALGRGELDEADIGVLVEIVLRSRTLDAERPVVLGISFGGSYALVAAADERLRDQLGLVATFGAAFDLASTVSAIVTGKAVVGGEVVEVGPMPRARRAVRQILVRMGADPGEIAEVFAARDPRVVTGLLERAVPGLVARLEDISPSGVASRIEAPVVAMHAARDPLVPETELAALAAVMPDARTVRVSGFEHVDPTGVRALDAWSAWRFTAWLLAAQERGGVNVRPHL